MSTMVEDPRLVATRGGLRGLVSLGVRRLREGELGPLPVIFGLVLIALIFQSQNSNFLTARNLTNLFQQASAVGVISVGLVLVLLLGEIDLSVGSVSGFTAAIMAVLNVEHGVRGPIAVLAAILSGTLIGLFFGLMRTKVGVPSFIVTLAGITGFTGAQLYILGSSGTINISDSFITDLMNRLLPVWLGWTLAIGLIALYAVGLVLGRGRRMAAGLTVEPIAVMVVRLIVLAVPVLVMVAIMNSNRGVAVPVQGVPEGVAIFLGFVVVFDLITRRTRFGRHVYAVGGNEEAARRAGTNVDRVRIAVFMTSSSMAACGGVLAASYLYAVNQSSGGSDTLLNAIAAVVIGGTSLFGGRGSVWSALLGALVIYSIANGMDLLAYSSSVKFMVTGGVLLAAVTIDAISRRGRAAAGRV